LQKKISELLPSLLLSPVMDWCHIFHPNCGLICQAARGKEQGIQTRLPHPSSWWYPSKFYITNLLWFMNPARFSCGCSLEAVWPAFSLQVSRSLLLQAEQAGHSQNMQPCPLIYIATGLNLCNFSEYY